VADAIDQRSKPAESIFEEVHGPLPVECTDLTLRMAMNKLGPAFGYELHVSQVEYLDTINRIRQLTAAPLAFQINVHQDHRLRGAQWYLTVPGNNPRYGSRSYT